MLLDAGMELVEDAGAEVFDKLKDGKSGRLDNGELYFGDRRVAVGETVDEADLEASFDEARATMVDRLEALSGNLVEFAKTESPLYIDGLGIPDANQPLAGRKAWWSAMGQVTGGSSMI